MRDKAVGMGHWGWRPVVLCAFICVLVVSCGDTSQHTPTFPPTGEPQVTLTIRGPQPVTPTMPGLPTTVTIQQATAKPAQTEDYPPTALPLSVDYPVCYETPDGGILCLGRITNPYTYPIEHVIVRVAVFKADAQALDEVFVTLPQRILPAGESAPYRALFTNAEKITYLSDEFAGVRADIIRAETPLNALQLPSLAFEDVAGDWVDGVYQVTGELVNTGDSRVQTIRVVVTLYDSEERVMGFRTVEIGHLGAGQGTRLQVNITPQISSTDLHPILYAEAEW